MPTDKESEPEVIIRNLAPKKIMVSNTSYAGDKLTVFEFFIEKPNRELGVVKIYAESYKIVLDAEQDNKSLKYKIGEDPWETRKNFGSGILVSYIELHVHSHEDLFP